MHMSIIIVQGRRATRGSNPAAANQFQFSATAAAIPTPIRRYSTKRCRAKYLITLLRNRPAASADVALCRGKLLSSGVIGFLCLLVVNEKIHALPAAGANLIRSRVSILGQINEC
jgi:hypothetical protein